MTVDKGHYKAGERDRVPHNCSDRSKVIECDSNNDIRQCRVCGKEWVERCNFDEDYA